MHKGLKHVCWNGGFRSETAYEHVCCNKVKSLMSYLDDPLIKYQGDLNAGLAANSGLNNFSHNCTIDLLVTAVSRARNVAAR